MLSGNLLIFFPFPVEIIARLQNRQHLVFIKALEKKQI